MDLSFIIPAYNEAENIENVIGSIKRYVPDVYQYEVVVIDHGSSDNTVNLAETSGANVLVHPQGTIAGLRNFGVTHSSGTVLIFLDADILLTADWASSIVKVVPLLNDGERILTGSWYCISDQPTWIEKYWFKPLERGDNSHINSGHLIISRLLFDETGGFNEKLETGEDYELSIRAKTAGIKLIDDVRLRVIHEGYPKSLAEFAKREFWHGKGDATSFSALLQSKVAMVALLFILLHLMLFVFSYMQNGEGIAVFLIVISVIVTGTAWLKFRNETILTILINSFIYYVYFWARGLSVLSLPAIRTLQKRTR